MKKFLCLLLVSVLLCSFCGCTTTDNKDESKDVQTSTESVWTKAEKGQYKLTLDVSEGYIESLLTFFEAEPSDELTQAVNGKIYYNYAENIVLIDSRSVFTPINFTCSIEDDEYQIVMQYGEDKIKNISFDGTGILQISISDISETFMSTGMWYDMSTFVIIKEDATPAETITLNGENVDYSQTVENEAMTPVITEVSKDNIEKMKTIDEAVPNNMYAKLYPDATVYTNEAKNIIIFYTGDSENKPILDIKIGKSEENEDVFLVTIKCGGKTYENQHKGYGVLSIFLMEGSYMAANDTNSPSTNTYTK